jgi:hypothetical protein
MLKKICTIKLEIYPIKAERLEKPKHSLPKEGIQPKRSGILI